MKIEVTPCLFLFPVEPIGVIAQSVGCGDLIFFSNGCRQGAVQKKQKGSSVASSLSWISDMRGILQNGHVQDNEESFLRQVPKWTKII